MVVGRLPITLPCSKEEFTALVTVVEVVPMWDALKSTLTLWREGRTCAILVLTKRW